MATTDALTMREMSRLGWIAQKVEHWIPGTQRRRDLYGVYDQLAVTQDGTVVFVQTTTRSNASSRRKKMKAATVLPRLLLNPNVKVELWTWDKKDRLKRESVTAALGAPERSVAQTELATPRFSIPASSSSIARLGAGGGRGKATG